MRYQGFKRFKCRWPGCLLWLILLLVVLVACGPAPAGPAAPATTGETAESQTPATLPAPDPYADERRSMVEHQIGSRKVSDEKVLQAMRQVPRHEFVPADYRDQAYEDHPLPIGYGQTISQPYIVAFMTEEIGLQPDERVLEIGTGSGYQAAVLAELTDNVYTIEIVPELARRAQQTFDRLGYDEIVARQGDGYFGWEEHAPFDAIVVTAAPDHVPQPLVNQLADGGKMVIPVGPPGGYQSLWLLERKGEEVLRRNLGGVRFVPLTRAEE